MVSKKKTWKYLTLVGSGTSNEAKPAMMREEKEEKLKIKQIEIKELQHFIILMKYYKFTNNNSYFI